MLEQGGNGPRVMSEMAMVGLNNILFISVGYHQKVETYCILLICHIQHGISSFEGSVDLRWDALTNFY